MSETPDVRWGRAALRAGSRRDTRDTPASRPRSQPLAAAGGRWGADRPGSPLARVSAERTPPMTVIALK